MNKQSLMAALKEEMAANIHLVGDTDGGLSYVDAILKALSLAQQLDENVGVDEVKLRMLLADTLHAILLGNEYPNALITKLRPYLQHQNLTFLDDESVVEEVARDIEEKYRLGKFNLEVANSIAWTAIAVIKRLAAKNHESIL